MEVVLTGITHFCKDRNSLYPTFEHTHYFHVWEETVFVLFLYRGWWRRWAYIYEHLVDNFVTDVERSCNHNGIYVNIVGVPEGLKEYVNQVLESKRHLILE